MIVIYSEIKNIYISNHPAYKNDTEPPGYKKESDTEPSCVKKTTPSCN